MKILVLGGTTEASSLAHAIADKHIPAIFSYAGRVSKLKEQPLPVRVGGFGGVEGLCDFISSNKITHIIDSTHPFAHQMSMNAYNAAKINDTKLLSFSRPPWEPSPGDNWERVNSIEAAVNSLSIPRKRVMLAIGRMHLGAFKKQSQHYYLLRMVDNSEESIPFNDCEVLVDRGPFKLENEQSLIRSKGIELIVCKNSGGKGAEAKLTAARNLGIPVLIIDRPQLPERHETKNLTEVMRWIGHATNLGV